MQFRKLTDVLSVAPQLAPEDVAAAAAAGFRAILNNRPDGEEPRQPAATEIAEACARAGLEYRHDPVISCAITPTDVARFAAAARDLPGPVLAFCRTGTRCAKLWALSQVNIRGVDAVISATAAAGYDLRAMTGVLQAEIAPTREAV